MPLTVLSMTAYSAAVADALSKEGEGVTGSERADCRTV
jgi:hypothetical protein